MMTVTQPIAKRLTDCFSEAWFDFLSFIIYLILNKIILLILIFFQALEPLFFQKTEVLTEN